MSKNYKLFLYPILYWILLVIIPFVYANIMLKNKLSIGFWEYTNIYIIFVSPFLYFIPYQLIKKQLLDKKQKILFVLLGLVAPYVIIGAIFFIGIYLTGGPRF